MAQRNVTIRMDEDLKKEFDKFCSAVGMNTTTAFCIFAKTVVREQKIPFVISTETPNSETITAIENARNNTNLSRSFSSVSELMEDLNA